MKKAIYLGLVLLLLLSGLAACGVEGGGGGGSADSSVAGSWSNISNQGAANDIKSLVINEQGTGVMVYNNGSTQAFMWNASGNDLTLVFTNGGSKGGTFAVSGGTMTIDWGTDVDIYAK